MPARKTASQEAHDPAQSVVFHDYFAIRGGGERLALTLAKVLHADLVYGFRTADSYEPEAFPPNSRTLELEGLPRLRGLHIASLVYVFWRQRAVAARYKNRLFSGVTAVFAAPPKRQGGRNIYYCHTPPRFLFDQRAHFLSRLPRLARPLANVLLWLFEYYYRRMVARMDVIIANSVNTQQRIATYLKRESVIVHPPVETQDFTFLGQEGYYLSTARLTPLKRVETIVQAFLRLPDHKLVVASGGEELQRLKALAAGAPNISFTDWTDEATLRELIGKAIAVIYIPVDEDFGMSPVEAMAAGKPVIGVAEGGLLETQRPGETGILLTPPPTVEGLMAAVQEMTAQKAQSMRETCEAQAQTFSSDKFAASMERMIARADHG